MPAQARRKPSPCALSRGDAGEGIDGLESRARPSSSTLSTVSATEDHRGQRQRARPAHAPLMQMPPSTGITAPVTFAPARDAR